MSGLNCGTPSRLAWPYLRDGLDAAVAVANAEAAVAAATWRITEYQPVPAAGPRWPGAGRA